MGRVLTARTQCRSSPDAWQGPDTYSAKFQQRRNKVNIVKDKMSQGPEEGVINSHCGEAVLSQPGRMTRILTAGKASPAEEQPELTAGRTTHPRVPRQGLRARPKHCTSSGTIALTGFRRESHMPVLLPLQGLNR